MKKLLSASLLILASLMILTGCGSGEEGAPDGMKTASPKDVDYVLYVPEEWQVDTAEGSILTSAHVQDGDNSNITMMTYTNDDGQTDISAYWDNYEKSLAGIFDLDAEGNTTFQLVKPVGEEGTLAPIGEEDQKFEESELGGERCQIYRYLGVIGGSSDDPIPLYFMQVITYHNGDFYIFTYTATTENDRHLRNDTDVGRILTEFRFK